MKKDTTVTLRMNSEVKEVLQSKGYSMQRIFDEAISLLVNITKKVSLKKFATREGMEE